MSDLQKLLTKYREAAQGEREKGTYFENLIQDYLTNDPTWASQFDKVWTFADWAKEHELNANDTGIDLVARQSIDGTFCAIQCKFYAEDKIIQKGDIDSFFSASSTSHFTRRLFVDSTRKEWGKNALATMDDQAIETTRVRLDDLERSPIDWSIYAVNREIKLAAKKELRPHQAKALEKVEEGFKTAKRGKLIMACGTGKTFTSLKIAENQFGKGKRILYLVPSLALMSQTVGEWSIDTQTPLLSFAACSDVQVGKRKASDDIAQVNVHDLAYPATTDAKKLAEKIESQHSDERMTVVFSTYQSISVISAAQFKYGMEEFDLIVCDEAHRTTGVTLEGEDESNFVKVHNQEHIKGKKRLYMTATPRIYSDAVQTKANEFSAELCSMDDPAYFGETFHEISFSWAVQNNLLTDYKVIVLAVDEGVISSSVQRRLTDEDSQLLLDDAAKIIGCYRALAKHGLKEDLINDADPMRRAVAFCKDIKSSKLVKTEFKQVVDEYLESVGEESGEMLSCEIDHVDGTYKSKERQALLGWLSGGDNPHHCRILSNARCLSEGVDVPSLDAILFMHPRKSQVDVVQSVGRVMRRAPGKNMGYVILPVGVPANMSADEALNNNDKYKVVWQILNALRAHDDRFDSHINKAGLGVDVSDHIEVVAVTNTLPEKTKAESTGANLGSGSSGDGQDREGDNTLSTPTQESFIFDEFSKAIMARIVKKCGTRDYWEDWATDIAKIAQTHVTRIKSVVTIEGSKEQEIFQSFLKEIQDDINSSVSEDDAIEMLAQHIITKPVFDALFEGYSFTEKNSVSVALQKILDELEDQNLDKESESLQKFYNSVRMRAEGIDSASAKQKIVVELYDKFFRNAFPKMTQKLGIVYTPVEVVDFIIHSINDILLDEFGQTLGSKGVHILDPFTGTGTFITRLLQSGLIKPEELEHKYQNEIHANEIVLLAYYIAAINIEQVYHELRTEQGHEDYERYRKITLCDTFRLDEKDLIKDTLEENSENRKFLRDLDVRVIMSNPPYSAGQTSANDNAENVSYPLVDERIAETYVANSSATLKNALYDSYIRAIRWGSDKIGESGIMGYVSNAGWVEGNATDGLRKCLSEEHSNLYVFHLRGNQRTQGEQSRREGGKIFGSGSRSPIAITLFVKNPNAKKQGQIHYHDIGDYLTQQEKLDIIKTFKSVNGITERDGWKTITPDKHHDWLNQRDDSFDNHIELGNNKKQTARTVFKKYYNGLKTGRDAWCYNQSRKELENNVSSMIVFYNNEVEKYKTVSQRDDALKAASVDDTKISWNRSLKNDFKKQKKHTFDSKYVKRGMYRPFLRSWSYTHKPLNDLTSIMYDANPHRDCLNRFISMSGIGSNKGFSVFMSNDTPDVQLLFNGQCFPLKLYDKVEESEGLFSGQQTEVEYEEKDSITDDGLAHFTSFYPGEEISKDDLFYYIYGLLHSEDYRTRFADNLSKQLPRIPRVKTAEDFWAFSKAGRALGDLHVNYETVEPYPVNYADGGLLHGEFTAEDYRVVKMKFGKGKTAKEKDKTTVIYNKKITMTGIPLEAYDYIVNGKSALEWVMERQVVKTDKASGIVNDANDYAIETMGDPAYPLKLFQRVITVSLETIKIVNGLPKLDIEVVE
ncbi:DEAD/DEAH box helicase [Kiloniella sp.]|uniref:DEAD/DEAH box helicase n=1 Tax=Kiloniella sp. TaxID=1938587 RepID=UPI003A94ABF2